MGDNILNTPNFVSLAAGLFFFPTGRIASFDMTTIVRHGHLVVSG